MKYPFPIAFLTVAAFGQTPAAIKIPEGTEVRLELAQDLSSAKSHKNDQVRLQVLDDVRIGGTTVIAKGAAATAHVTLAQKKGAWGKNGSLEFTLDYVKAVDGTNVRVRATAGHDSQQGVIRPQMLMGVIGVFLTGKDVELPQHTKVPVFTDADKEIATASVATPSSH